MHIKHQAEIDDNILQDLNHNYHLRVKMLKSQFRYKSFTDYRKTIKIWFLRPYYKTGL